MFYLPAEWEPQSGVQLTWPHAATDWAPMLNEVLVTYRAMADAIQGREQLLIAYPPTNDTWARDHGFITLVDDEGGQPLLLDFKFNGWGEKFPSDLDNALNRRLYREGRISGRYESHLDFVLEGGSIESDGRGTLMTTTQCLLAPHRNQPMTQADIERYLKRALHAERVIWIDHGHLEGDDTDGHIDTLARFAPNDTIIYIGCDNPADAHYHSLGRMKAQLQTLRTLDGKPYRLVELPLPRPIYDADGERLPATYANFLFLNGALLCPTYGQDDLDRRALQILRDALPQYEVVGIDCQPLIRQHGSLHCCTMQFPKNVIIK